MVIKQEVAFGIVRGLRKFWKCEELQDFTVTLGKVKFGCHRLLLAACSDFFRGLFRSGMKETEIQNVDIKDISCKTFELILETVYTGYDVLTNDNVIDIWRAAHQLQIQFLLFECEDFVIENLSVENYIEYYLTCKALNSDFVLEKVWSFILKNCNAFFQTSCFLELSMADVLKLIKSHDLEPKSEDDVIHAILKWVEYTLSADYQSELLYLEIQEGDKSNSDTIDHKEEIGVSSGDEIFNRNNNPKEIQNNDCSTASKNIDKCVQTESYDNQRDVEKNPSRDRHLLMLLSNSRICLASQDCLKMLVNHPMAKDNKEIKNIVIDALFYHLQVGKSNGQWPSRSEHRNYSDFFNCLVDVRQIRNDVFFSAYSFARNEWFELSRLDNVESKGTVKLAVIGEKLYALFKANYDNQLRFFQMENGKWSKEKLSPNFKSWLFFLAAVDNLLYILSEAEQTVWKVDPILGKVKEKFRSPELKALSHIVSHDQYILVFCSLTSEGVDETVVRCFDTSQNTWKDLNNLEGLANGMTSFKDNHFTYLLQSNGNLWKVVKPQTKSDIINFEYVVKLWSCNWPLYGAATFMDELYIYGAKSDVINFDPNLQRSLPGVFNKVNYMDSKYTDSSIAIPCILKRKYLD